MKRSIIIVLLIFYLFVSSQVKAEILQGGVEKVWTIDSAREEAFKNLKSWLNLSWASPIDPNLIENKQALNNRQGRIKNRIITQFDDGSYGVWVLDEDNYDKVYYYFASGKLVSIDFSIFPTYINNLQDYFKYNDTNQIYPIKIYKHSYPDGKIINITMTVKDGNSYMFKPSGVLEFHWVGADCYDDNGKKILTRETY